MFSCTGTISRSIEFRSSIRKVRTPCKIHSRNPCSCMHQPCSSILVKTHLQLNIGEQLVSKLSVSEL